MEVNVTSALFTNLLPGLLYDVIICAVSIFDTVSVSGFPSDKVTFSTVPSGEATHGCICQGCDHCFLYSQFQH